MRVFEHRLNIISKLSIFFSNFYNSRCYHVILQTAEKRFTAKVELHVLSDVRIVLVT